MSLILVIEDEPAIRSNIQEILELEGFQVITADRGSTGLQQIQNRTPDLIICDIMMPDLDGYQVLENLRQAPQTKLIPFIFLTAKNTREDTRKGMNLGANDYLVKPFTNQELLEAIRSRLQIANQHQEKVNQEIETLRKSISRSLSHEINTPLNGILGSIELLLQYENFLEPAEQAEMLKMIRDSANRLWFLAKKFQLYAELEMIVKDPKKIQELRHELHGVCNVRDLTFWEHQFSDSLGIRLQDITIELEDGVLQVPPLYCQFIFKELTENASKFSDVHTPITISGKIHQNSYLIRVCDRGRGMTESQISQVAAYKQFERDFYEQQGMGLGLSIVQHITYIYQGKFKIQSQPMKGTCVALLLPLCLDYYG